MELSHSVLHNAPMSRENDRKESTYSILILKVLDQLQKVTGKLTKADLERVVRSGPKRDIQERRFNEKRNEKCSQ